MKDFLKTIPIPMCGLILGTASLGNLLKEYNLMFLANSFGLIAGIMLILIIAKIALTFSHVKDNLKDPIVASVSPTFTMATMVLCTYLVNIEPLSAITKYIWLIAIVIHYGLMIYFTYNFIIKPKVEIEHLYPSWFIVYVGIGVISVTSPAFFPFIGQINFWIGLIFYLGLLPLIIHRVFLIKNMPDPTLPLMTIIAAPGSLELTGYLKAFANPNHFIVIALLVLSQLLYWFIITRVVKLLKLPFYPSYAAFTFPLVISAIAITVTNKYLINLGYNFQFLNFLAIAETIIASAIIIYVLIRYVMFINKQNNFIKLHDNSQIKNPVL